MSGSPHDVRGMPDALPPAFAADPAGGLPEGEQAIKLAAAAATAKKR